MGIKEYLARRRARRKGKVIDLPKYYKPSESGSMPGGTSGYVSTSDPSIPGAFEGYTSGGGGGGGGISTTTSSTSQLSTRTPTTSTTTTYKDIQLPTTPSREIQTQQQIKRQGRHTTLELELIKHLLMVMVLWNCISKTSNFCKNKEK